MKRIEYLIEESTTVLNNTICLNLVPKNKNEVVKFRSGQYGLISFLHGNVLSPERPFSFASSMLHTESLQFGFRVAGKFTDEMAKLVKGDSVFVRGPYGAFIYDEKKHTDTVFLAAGIGITPFLSSIRSASEKSLANKMTLIYSNNFANEIPFADDLRELERMNKNFSAYYLVTKGEVDAKAKEFIQGRISKSVLSNVLGADLARKTFFICGPEQFTIATIGYLKELGVHEKQIKTEGFSQIPISFFEKGTSIFPLVAGTSALLMFATFFSIYQLETVKALSKAKDAEAYSQQVVNEQQVLLEQQASQELERIKQEQKAKLAQDLLTSQQLVNEQNAQKAAVKPTTSKPKVVRKVITAPKTTTPSKPATTTPVTPTPVVKAPKPVVTPPVYTPPKTTPPPVYTPPPRTAQS
jgi:ferredoxin-NADP reductase